MRTTVQRRDVKQRKKSEEKTGGCHQTHDNTDQFASPSANVKSHVREKCEGEEETEEKSDEMSIVVDHRKQTDGE